MFATSRFIVVLFAMALLGSAACSKHGGNNPNQPSGSVTISVTPESGKLGDVFAVVPILNDGSGTLSCSASLGELSKTSGIVSGTRIVYYSRNAGMETIICTADSVSGSKTLQIAAPPRDSGYVLLSTPLRFVYDDDGTPAPLTVTISLVTPSFGSQVVGGFFGLPDGGTGTYCIDHPGNCWGMKGEFRWDDGVQNLDLPGLWLSDTPGQYQVGAVSPGSTVLSQVQPFDTLPYPGHFRTFGPGQALKYLEGKARYGVWSADGIPVTRQMHLPPQPTGWHF